MGDGHRPLLVHDKQVIDLLAANKIANMFVVDGGRPVAVAHIAELIQSGYVS